MTSTLASDDIEQFYIRLYFDISKGYFHAAMQRAYRDFNRTIENIPPDQEKRSQWRHELYGVLRSQVDGLLGATLAGQQEFDRWHEQTCGLLRENSGGILTVGQAQKWINMTLKYLYAFGEMRISGISKNYHFFHIPVDNIIQNVLQREFGVKRLPYAWSRIKDYSTYYEYQTRVRAAFKGKIVMDEEFKLFNRNFL
ncbi:hypothetical protein V9K67_21650 [Paraflavisolibacter sp. H34]|uniref:hypothetical protein n=1 Tax=Huijunlia imazamoxiresistens TaxID=3127457 RepID=UPI0030193758